MAQRDFTNYTVNVPHQAAWLVYFNGVEVPVVSVQCQFGVWQIPELRITMVPHVILQRLGFEDRIQVEVFYLDEWFDPSNPEFKFLAEFEIVGWSYTNMGTSRFIEVQCRAQTQIMEQLYFYYMSAVDDIVVNSSPATAQNPNLYSQSMVYYPASLFLEGLVRQTESSDSGTVSTGPEGFVRSPFEFVSNVFKALLAPIDVTAESASTAEPGKLPANAASVAGRNFFARWMNLTDFRRRWAGLPYFDSDDAKSIEGCFPLLKATQSTEVMNALQQHLGQSIGHSGSMWQLLQTIYSTMFFEIVTIPGPPVVSIQKKTGLLKGAANRRKNGSVIRNSANTFGGILHHLVKPQCVFAIPPRCNMIFPSMITQYTFQEGYMSQPTRLYLGEKYMSNIVSAQAQGSIQALVGELLTTGYPPVVAKRMELYLTDPKQNTKNFLIYPEEIYKGPVTEQRNAPPWLYILEQKYKASAQTAYEAGDWNRMGRKKIKEAMKPIVSKYAGKYNIPAAMVYGIVERESGFVPNNISWDGGGGLMQLQVAGEWTNPHTGKSKRTVDTVEFAYKLAKRKFGWEGRTLDQVNRLDPDDNLKMGIALLHHYMVKRPKQVTGSPGDPNDLSNVNTKRGILAFKFGASDGSLIWKFKFKPGDDNVYRSDGVTIHESATKSWKRFKAAFTKWKSRDLTPPQTVEETPAVAEPEDTDAQPQAETNAPAEDALQSVFSEASLAGGVNSPLGRLFRLYARYEFYRSRFEKRAGGVTTVFNPYIVPGFPAVIFDEKTSGFDVFGYVTQVTHNLSAAAGSPNMSTSINFAFCRSFPEFIKILRQGVEESVAEQEVSNYDCGPTEPIPDVAEVFQRWSTADDFYRQVFFASVRKKAAFDWEETVAVTDVDSKPLDPSGGTAFDYAKGVLTTPKPKFYDQFRSADAAMLYIARPVCTLRDFVELRHGKSIGDLAKEGGVVKGMDTSFFSSTRAGGRGQVRGGATFWGRIDAFLQGPGNPADSIIQRITNVGDAPDYPPNADGTWDIITAGFGVPQTRQDWDTALRRYRAIVRGEGRYATPQL